MKMDVMFLCIVLCLSVQGLSPPNTPNWTNWHDMIIVELGGIQKEYIGDCVIGRLEHFSPCLSYTMGDML